MEKDARVNKDRKGALDNAVAAQKVLEAGDTLYAMGARAGVDLEAIRELVLLTTKPFLYVFNLDEDQLSDDALKATLSGLVAPVDAIYLDAKLEMDLAELEPRMLPSCWSLSVFRRPACISLRESAFQPWGCRHI